MARIKYKLKDGTLVPGVTTVMGDTIPKPALIQWANKEGLAGRNINEDKSANIGSIAHYLIECHLKNETPKLDDYAPNLVKQAETCLIKYWDWEKENKPEFIKSELSLVHEQYGYGGTIDLLCKLHDKLTLIDFKSSKAIYGEYLTQVAAYRELLIANGHIVEGVRILRIGKDDQEGFEERVCGDELEIHLERFKACLRLYRINKKLKEDR